MINYTFKNAEDELFHVIHTNGTTFDDYQRVVEKVQNLNYTDNNDTSFLHVAICEDKIDIALDLMKRGIDIDIQRVDGFTAAMLAASGEKWELLREILKYHPNINLKTWGSGTTLLLNVVSYYSKERNRIAKELLEMGANPYAQTRSGNSPLKMVNLLENQELMEAFQQVERPCQEEPEKFRVPRKITGVFPIKMSDYQKYYCVENTTLEYLKEKISDYAKIFGGKKRKSIFTLIPITGYQWIVITCLDKINFFNYHDLMSWICGLDEDLNPPAQTICVALHKCDDRLSYYGIMDKLKYGDNIVGRFQNRESFSIYLPEAMKKNGGNAKSYYDVLPIKDINLYLASCGFDESWIKESSDMPNEKIEVELPIS